MFYDVVIIILEHVGGAGLSIYYWRADDWYSDIAMFEPKDAKAILTILVRAGMEDMLDYDNKGIFSIKSAY
jgi:hypothetical protein